MKFWRYACLFLILILLAGSVVPVKADLAYYFQVTDQAVVVSINTDGSINIDYTMTFLNDAGAHDIDLVDIGLPNYNYKLKNITADVNGVALPSSSIMDSTNDAVQPGITLDLGSNAIPAGGSGKVHAYITNVTEVIYPGTQTEAEPYASLEFSPNYFDGNYCHGNTNYQFTTLLPAGIKDGESRYYVPENWPTSAAPESKIMSDGRIYYTWYSTDANDYTVYKFGASFPARYLAAGAVVTKPYVPPSTTGKNTISFSSGSVCPILFCAGFAIFFIWIIYAATIGAKKRKMQYLPPKILMEGHGVKRGLTAVEAAVLMEQPMDKIFTMILFGVLKKNAAEVTSKDPLELTQASPIPADLYGYETDFLAAFAAKDASPRRVLLQTMMVNLIKSVGEKMKGFSRKETVAFYEDIMKRAWDQVEAAGTPDVKAQVYDEVMDWTMLDNKYENRTQNLFSGPMIIPAPIWWWRYDPTFARPISTGGLTGGVTPPPLSGGKSISMPSLPGSAFAAGVVNSVSNFSSKVLGGLPGFTSGVTNLTNPPPPPSTYHSSGGGFSGGGHSCACACACAGCACACAGGGR
jgi:hypothetical protein